jgi:RNA polymerase sigma factor (sigma-70 family)
MSIDTAMLEGSAAEQSDLCVINDVLHGNRERFAVLVRRYNQRLFRIGMGYLRQPDRVEDMMQNTYLKAFLNLSRFQQNSTFSTWLTRIMINECLQFLRSQQRRPQPSDALGDRVEEEITEPDVAAQQASNAELRLLLENAITQLPPTYRLVYLLREIEHLDTQQTADALGVTTESVRVRLHRAREMLKQQLLDTAAGLELFRFGDEHCHAFTSEVMAAVRAAR